MTQYQVHKRDISQTRLVPDRMGELRQGQVKVKIEAFSFTANNITYWALGDQLGYWQFFPAADNQDGNWGIIPVWGFAEVLASKHEQVPVGERLFGYFPSADELIMQPDRVSGQLLFDATAHRVKLPASYNMYRRVNAEPGYDSNHDALRMLLFPLHLTAFTLHDMLASQNWFGAEQVIIISASSKTSLGLAFALHEDANAPKVVGMTSHKNQSFVDQTGHYQQTVTYDEVGSIDNSLKTVIVDMSGNGDLMGQLHSHLAEQMVFTSHVGLTHWDESTKGPGYIEERSQVFFAPSHIHQRYQDWGPEKFEQKANQFIQRAAVDSLKWLTVFQVDGLAGLADQFDALCQGQLPPNQGLTVKM